MTRRYCDGPTLLRAVAAGVANLERHVEEVDALNVFPVPDGDTGSNMLATMRAALAEAEALPESQRDLERVADALSLGALKGARGNSGVILSQIIRGMTDGTDGRRVADGLHLSLALRRASDSAYGSLAAPVEGTILTVIRDAAAAAEVAARRRPHIEVVLAVTVEAAARSVERTPSLLPVLREAGVVDSGGQGLFRILEGALQLGGLGTSVPSRPPPDVTARVERAEGEGARGHDDAHGNLGSYGYEVVYLLASDGRSIDVDGLRAALGGIGDSVVVAGDERAARVHAHGPRPDLAIGLGLAQGRLAQVSVVDLDDQVHQHADHRADHAAAHPAEDAGPGADHADQRADHAPVPEAPPTGTALVVVANADGIASLFTGMGVTSVVRPGHGLRPSSGEIARAVIASRAADVLVLPNDGDGLLAAQQAAGLAPGQRVTVIPTRDAAQGVAAVLSYDPRLPLADQVERMHQACAQTRSFRVARATRGAVLSGREVRSGQHVALDPRGGLLAVAEDVPAVTLEALAGLGEGFELVTLYVGRLDEPPAADVADAVRRMHPGAEVEIVRGGQPNGALLVAVE